MTILPQFLDYLQTLPLPLPKMFYDQLNKLLGQFIWNDRKARLCLKLLYLPYERGRLQLPNLRWYYMAAQLTSASYYFSTAPLPGLASIKSPSPIYHQVYIYILQTLKHLTDVPKIPFLKIQSWFGTLHKHIGDMAALSQFTPVWSNKQFTPGWKDGGFRSWNTKAFQKVKD